MLCPSIKRCLRLVTVDAQCIYPYYTEFNLLIRLASSVINGDNPTSIISLPSISWNTFIKGNYFPQ